MMDGAENELCTFVVYSSLKHAAYVGVQRALGARSRECTALAFPIYSCRGRSAVRTCSICCCCKSFVQHVALPFSSGAYRTALNGFLALALDQL